MRYHLYNRFQKDQQEDEVDQDFQMAILFHLIYATQFLYQNQSRTQCILLVPTPNSDDQKNTNLGDKGQMLDY